MRPGWGLSPAGGPAVTRPLPSAILESAEKSTTVITFLAEGAQFAPPTPMLHHESQRWTHCLVQWEPVGHQRRTALLQYWSHYPLMEHPPGLSLRQCMVL